MATRQAPTTTGSLLGGRVKYRQFAAGHRSGFEPVLLAAAVPARPGDRILEAGCGAAAGLLCLAARVGGLAGTGVEIDAALTNLANENLINNGLASFHCITADVLDWHSQAVFDHVMANPPWHPHAGTASPDAARKLAHQAAPGLLAGWIAALAACLKPRGSITLILPAASYAEAATSLAAARCGGITLYPLWPRAGQAAKQVILQARRGSRTPARVLPGLVLHGQEGITPQAEAVLREGSKQQLF